MDHPTINQPNNPINQSINQSIHQPSDHQLIGRSLDRSILICRHNRTKSELTP